MSKECRSLNAEIFPRFCLGPSLLDICICFVIRNSCFVIVHSSVAFAHDKVQTSEHRGNVAHHAARKHFRQDAQIDKGRRADLKAMGYAAAFTVDVETELAFWILRREINFARWRVKAFGHDDEVMN